MVAQQQQPADIIDTDLVSLSLECLRLVISSRFFFFYGKSFTAPKPLSVKYEDGNGANGFHVELVESGYLVFLLFTKPFSRSFYIKKS